MGKRRKAVVFGAGVVALGLIAAAVGFCWPGLPDPATADRDGLLRWLVTRDLGQETYETRLVLARRMEQEFSQRIDWPAVGQCVDGKQKDRLWANVLLLLEPWFADKVDGYFQLSQAQRPAFVDRTLQLVENWQGASALLADDRRAGPVGHPQPAGTDRRAGSAGHPQPAGTAGPTSSTSLIEVLVQRIAKWTESATPQRRQQIHDFVLAVQSRWLQRALGGV